MLQEDKEIIYSSEGKPSLGDHSFFISISHTKGYVAVILSPIAPVGIDIEQYGHRVKRVYDRFIRPDEQVEPYWGDVTWSMLLHWSAKETIFKSMENAGREYKKYALLAGFTEIGETLEETVSREVMEEVGLKVKNITYYKNQPWAFSDTLLMGFFCELDGSDQVKLDEN